MKFDTITTLLLNELWGTSSQGTQYHGGDIRNVNPTKVRDTNIYKPVDIKVGQTASGEVAITGSKEEMAIEEAGMTAARAMLLFATALKADPIVKSYMQKIMGSKDENLSPEELVEFKELQRTAAKYSREGDVSKEVQKRLIELQRKRSGNGKEHDQEELAQLEAHIDSVCFGLKNSDGSINRNHPSCVSATSDQRKKIAEIKKRSNGVIDKEEIKRIKGLIKRRLDTISSKELKPHLDDVVEYIFDFVADNPNSIRDLDLPKYMLGDMGGEPGEPKNTPEPTGPKTPHSGSGAAKEGISIKTTLIDSLPQIKEFAMKLLSTIPNILASTSKAVAALPDKVRTAATKQTQHFIKNVSSDNVIELVFSGKKNNVPVYAPAQSDEESLPTFKQFFNKR